ncbi:hypothetical protein [Bordetella genomosp. 13]|uniref:hypothetical protein n=1 Tax=Bordetella genomosp. 13 TaxID=463040 RepID=UPI0011A0BC8C|nr:hypothetical protein [Bordetella genomosp. 13]
MVDFSAFKRLVVSHAQKQEVESAAPVDWNARRQWWIHKVDGLLQEIRAWLGSLVDDGTIGFAVRTVTVDEQYLGTYQIQAATLDYAGQSMEILPVGSLVLGGVGRVDVTGPAGKVMLILLTPDDDAPSGPPQLDSAEWFTTLPHDRLSQTRLTEALFQQMFLELFGVGDEQ